MKDLVEIAKMLEKCVGEDVVGFFEREKHDFEQEVRVFTLVHEKVNFFTNTN